MYDDPQFKDFNWRDIITWNEFRISGFFGDYRWLSNFYPCEVEFDGIIYNSSEAAYMASKTLDKNLRAQFSTLKAKEAKILGSTIELRPNWDNLKYSFMQNIVLNKFKRNPQLKEKLLNTGSKYLEEALWWGDVYWGFDITKDYGLNRLGEILMNVREYLK